MRTRIRRHSSQRTHLVVRRRPGSGCSSVRVQLQPAALAAAAGAAAPRPRRRCSRGSSRRGDQVGRQRRRRRARGPRSRRGGLVVQLAEACVVAAGDRSASSSACSPRLLGDQPSTRGLGASSAAPSPRARRPPGRSAVGPAWRARAAAPPAPCGRALAGVQPGLVPGGALAHLLDVRLGLDQLAGDVAGLGLGPATSSSRSARSRCSSSASSACSGSVRRRWAIWCEPGVERLQVEQAPLVVGRGVQRVSLPRLGTCMVHRSVPRQSPTRGPPP